MIFDAFSNLSRYPKIPFAKEIAEFVSSRDCSKIDREETEIIGRDLFVRLGNYTTGAASEKQFEAHTVYADLQLVISGAEVMDISLEKNPKPVTLYKPEADIRFFEDPADISSVLVPAGHFTVFFPGELHKPGCHVQDRPVKVKKLVFKIKMPKNGFEKA